MVSPLGKYAFKLPPKDQDSHKGGVVTITVEKNERFAISTVEGLLLYFFGFKLLASMRIGWIQRSLI